MKRLKHFAVLVGLIGFGLGMGSGHFAWANICAGHCDHYAPAPDGGILCYCDAFCSKPVNNDCCQDDSGTRGASRTYVDAACASGGAAAEPLPAPPPPPPPPDSNASIIGKPCTQDSDCGEGVLCATGEKGFQDGYCYILGCSGGEGDTCPPGSGCLWISSGPAADVAIIYWQSVCLARCDSQDDCRAGYTCEGLGIWPTGLCRPSSGQSLLPLLKPCEADCGDGSAICGNGACESGESFENCPEDCPSSEQPKSPIGGACITELDCIDPGVCISSLTASGGSAPGGYCLSYDCEADSCPEGAGCFSLAQPGSENEPMRLCLATCQKDEDCRTGEGYTCKTGACFPKEWATLELVRLDQKIAEDTKKQEDGGGGGGCSLLRLSP